MTVKPKVFLNSVDVKNLIDLSWNQLGILLPCLTPKESTQAIKELIKELEALQSKLSENHKNYNRSQNRESEAEEEVKISEQDFVNNYQDRREFF